MTTPGIRRIAATGALALTMLGVSGPAASAGEDEGIETKRGAVTFTHRGERLTAADNLEDGLGIRAYLHWSEYGVEQSAYVTDRRGADGGPWVVDKDLDIREGVTVQLTMCYTDNGEDVMCSYAQRGEA
jgi:hypothetical protein